MWRLILGIVLASGCFNNKPAIEDLDPEKSLSEYAENPVRWDSGYKNRRVSVIGNVLVIANDNGPNILIAHKSGGMVGCSNMDSGEVSALTQGAGVILNGTIQGYDSGALVLTNCHVQMKEIPR